MRVMLQMAPAKLPLITSIGINPTVLAFTIVTAVLTALICGVVPALRASRPQIVDALRTSQGSTGLRAGRMLRNTVVVAEVALSFVLLIGSGLMLRSFVAILKVGAADRDATTMLRSRSGERRTHERDAGTIRACTVASLGARRFR